ncbi:MAG: pitrilysin family protein [Balneolaceae bacterium]|nr:pitrilysin family protein [Balneolaceae bacterium]
MNFLKTYLIPVLLFALITACATQEQVAEQESRSDSMRPENLEYPELNSYVQPEIETFELDNGIKFYLVEDREVPLMNLNILVRGGSFMVPDEKVGLASVMTSAMRNGGSEAYPEDELNQLLEDKAARIEFGMGFTNGSANLNALKEDFRDLLPVLVDVMMNPLLPQEKIDLAITQRRTAIARRNDDAQQIAVREFEKLIYGEESLQGRQVEHWTLDAITREDLLEFHGDVFTGENLMIGLVGDFDIQEMKSTLEDVFSSIPAGEENELKLPEVDYQFDSSIYFVDKPDVNQSVVLMGHIGGMRDNPDYAALQAMNEVLSGGFSGRLMQNVRSEQGLAYAVFGAYGSSALYPGQFYAGVFTQSSSTAEAIESVRREMVKLQQEPVSQQELDDTRESILNSLVFRYDSRRSVLSQRMSNEYFGLPQDAFDRYIEELRTLTPEDIQRVAREYMRPNQMRILVVGNSSEIGDQLSQFGEVQELDISIRRTQDEGDEVEIAGDVEAGREWFDRMKSAILVDAGTEITLKQEGRVEMSMPMTMTIDRTETLNFSEETFLIEMKNTPQGDITLDVQGNSGVLKVGGQEIPLPPAQLRQQLAEYYVHYLNVVINADEYTPALESIETVDGNEVAVLNLAGPQNMTIHLDTDSSLPTMLQYSMMNPQTGTDMDFRMYFEDWRVNDGVAIAYETRSVVMGQDQASISLTTHSVE